PVTFGVPMPRGAVFEPGDWTIADGERNVVADPTVLERGRDGSIRWLLIDAQLEAASSEPGPRTIELQAVPGEPTHVLSVEANDGCVLVDTGVLRVTFSPGPSFPFAKVEAADLETLHGAGTAFVVTDEAGRSASVRTTGATVEHDGRLRASIRVTGHVLVEGRQLDVVARVDVFAGRRLLRVRTTICNPEPARHPGNYWDLGDPGSVLIKDASLVLDLA